jgi:hypothetical protein
MKGETLPDAPIERIRRHLVALRMPRPLETLDHLVQQIERGQIGTIEAIEMLLAEELTVRESRRIKAALQMAASAPSRPCRGSTSPSSLRSTATAFWHSPSSTSSTAMRSCT